MKCKVKEYKNGLTLLSIPSSGSEAVTVMVLVKAGSDYEDKKTNGLSHFLEHMCFQGTKNRPNTGDVSRDFDKLGAQSNAFTGKEYTGYWAKAHSSKLSNIFEIVSDIYQNPIFKEDAIQREKGVVIEEIKMYEDLPHYKVSEVFEELLYGDQSAGRSIIGTEENIKSFSKKDLEDYVKKHYVAGKTTIIVSGNFGKENLYKLVERYFKNIKTGKILRKNKLEDYKPLSNIKIHYKETDQTHLVIGFHTFPKKHKDTSKIDLLSAVLGAGMSSRLFKKLRDELGICYYVRAQNNTAEDRGYFAISAGVSKGRVEEAIKAILEEVKNISENLVSKEELEKTKEYVIGNMYLSLETSDSLADFYAFQRIYGLEIKDPKTKEKIIKEVSSKDILLMAKKIFKPENIKLAIVGSVKESDSLKKSLIF